LVAGGVLVLGTVLVSLGATLKSPKQTVWAEPWFDVGIGVLALGVLGLAGAIRLYLVDDRSGKVSSTIEVGAAISRVIRLRDGMATPWREVLDPDSKRKLRIELGNGRELRTMLQSATTDEQLFEVQKRICDWRSRVLPTLADSGHSTLHDRFAVDAPWPRRGWHSRTAKAESLSIIDQRIKQLEKMLAPSRFQ
jgi:hypothetical protein